MSYEGYEQVICINGHAWNIDAYESSYGLGDCPYCKSRPIWHNSVDETNKWNPIILKKNLL